MSHQFNRSQRAAINAWEDIHSDWQIVESEFVADAAGRVYVRDSYAGSARDPADGHLLYSPPAVRVVRGMRS